MAAHPIITYANGQILRDAKGNVYFHDGSLFISTNGTINYPGWAGGKPLRQIKGLAGHWAAYYPNSSFLLEPMKTICYPTPPSVASQRTMSNGWTYSYENGQEILSKNWAATETIFHANGVKAWDGKKLYNLNEQPVSQVDLVQWIGPSGAWGYLWTLLRQDFGKLDMHFEIAFNLISVSYVHPISFIGKNQFPPIPFKDEFQLRIETGYWGELLMVHVGQNGLQFKFEQTPWLTPLPGPYPPYPYPFPFNQFPKATPQSAGNVPQWCSHLLDANRPAFMHNDPRGFVRKPHR